MNIEFKASFASKRYAKLFALPLVSAVIFTLLALFVVRLGYSKVNTDLKDIKTAKTEKDVLSSKIEILKKIKDSNLIKADLSYIALPDKNPGVWLVYHIRKIAEKYGLTLENISFSNIKEIETTKLKTTEVEVEIKSTNIEPINNFFVEIIKVAPLVAVKDVEIRTQEDKRTLNATAKVNIYWSDLPGKLPDLTEPLKGLSENELKTLGEVSSLTQPNFINLDPGNTVDRVEPFN